MKLSLQIIATILFSCFASATSVKAQSTSYPGADPLVCNEGDTMITCAVIKLDPSQMEIEGAGSLKVSVVEDTRCPRFARCREPGRLILKFSVIEANGTETPATELEFRRNQIGKIQFDLSDGAVLNLELLAVTHKISSLPPELFEIKIGYDLIPAM
jgi:hypothetical protein